ncbi:MAG: hypothetical protein P8Y80_05100 [Acidobacteriota bacterium]|jgi:hypothetical protein
MSAAQSGTNSIIGVGIAIGIAVGFDIDPDSDTDSECACLLNEDKKLMLCPHIQTGYGIR